MMDHTTSSGAAGSLESLPLVIIAHAAKLAEEIDRCKPGCLARPATSEDHGCPAANTMADELANILICTAILASIPRC